MDQFLRCKCEKTGQNFILELKKDGSKYVVVNAIQVDSATGEKLTSTVTQDTFVTSPHLLPCRKCGGRTISGCSCAETYFDCKKDKYNFGCVYCKKCKIIYDAVSSDGGTVTIDQGGSIDLSKLSTGKLEKVSIAGGWDEARDGYKDYDIDFSVFMIGNDSHERVYFHNLNDKSGSVHHYGDNLTGRTGYVSGMENDDEMIDVNLDRVPATYKSLYFVINVFSGQSFNQIHNVYLRMFGKNLKTLSYKVEQTRNGEKALVVAKLTRNRSDWKFTAIGKYYDTDLDGLEQICIETENRHQWR